MQKIKMTHKVFIGFLMNIFLIPGLIKGMEEERVEEPPLQDISTRGSIIEDSILIPDVMIKIIRKINDDVQDLISFSCTCKMAQDARQENERFWFHLLTDHDIAQETSYQKETVISWQYFSYLNDCVKDHLNNINKVGNSVNKKNYEVIIQGHVINIKPFNIDTVSEILNLLNIPKISELIKNQAIREESMLGDFIQGVLNTSHPGDVNGRHHFKKASALRHSSTIRDIIHKYKIQPPFPADFGETNIGDKTTKETWLPIKVLSFQGTLWKYVAEELDQLLKMEEIGESPMACRS